MNGTLISKGKYICTNAEENKISERNSRFNPQVKQPIGKTESENKRGTQERANNSRPSPSPHKG